MNYSNLRADVPESSGFFTVDELDESSRRLQAAYPELVRLETAGYSREGRSILHLTIGSGSKTALMFGCPHPNEPIGAMTLDFLSWELAEHAALREELDYTFHIIKCIDPDAVTLNQGWFKGPFTVSNYLRHYYRPAFHEQVAWTFPVDYKRIHFDAPIPETKILMDLIDRLKPDFLYSLHNLGFGGAYWYLTHDLPELYDAYYRCVKDMGIPRKLGEAEVPYATAYAPAVFKLLTVRDEYEYNSRYVSEDYAAASHAYGSSSGDYASRNGGKSFCFINELPYFYDARVDDLSPSDRTRRQAVMENCDFKLRHYEDLHSRWETVRALLDRPDNHFATSFKERMSAGMGGIRAQRKWAEENEAFAQTATVAQVFDNLYVPRFFQATATTLLLRACEMECKRAATPQEQALLCQVRDWAEDYLAAECRWLEENMKYHAIPIKSLVTVQAECGLRTAQYISRGCGAKD